MPTGSRDIQFRMEPVAIVGLSCRFPGAQDQEKFWQLLKDGRDAWSLIPACRLPIEKFYDRDRDNAGTCNAKHGYFLNQVDQFDAEFFGISPREAMSMDPQQRLMLELSYEALEDAGIPSELSRDSKTGVFFGVIWNDYATLWHRASARHITHHTLTGSHFSMIANRISYALDLRGPSLAIDTSCSSSLVAIHTACNSLRLRECTAALAGGVNLICAPDSFITMSQFGALAADGRSKTFAAGADGYGRGEGGGIVVLKLLSDALKAKDNIYCVILGGAVANDGKGLGVGIPNYQSQVDLITDAHRCSGISGASVAYVEAHGTGTAVGDPIEAHALGIAYAEGRNPDAPLAIGSVKTNVGHLEGAAGVASVIKVALALKHGEIPPSLNFSQPNPEIDFSGLKLKVQEHLTTWPSTQEPSRAAVTALGFGGTNCHLIFEAFSSEKSQSNEQDVNGPLPLVFSASNDAALEQMVKSTVSFLDKNPDSSLLDLAFTRAQKRSHLSHRAALFVRSVPEARLALENFIQHRSSQSSVLGSVTPVFSNKRVFVFPGQGSQWPGMGLGLLEQEACFRDSIIRFDDALASIPSDLRPSWTVREKLKEYSNTKMLESVDEVQPIICALQIALAELWCARGITPDAVIGHSMGEIAGAYIAQVLSLEDAVRIICTRSRLAARHASGKGAMALIELSAAKAEQLIALTNSQVSIATINGPSSVVLSGNRSELEKIVDDLAAKNVFCRFVRVDFASHCPLVEPMLPELLARLQDIKPRESNIDFYSTVSGEKTSGLELDAEYWARNIREPVLFSKTVEKALIELKPAFIEVSPHPSLLNSIEAVADACKHQVVGVSSLRRDKDESESLLFSLGTLYVHGHQPLWESLFPAAYEYKKVAIPNYPWQRKRFWPDNTFNAATTNALNRDEGKGQGHSETPDSANNNQTEAKEPSIRHRLREKVASILMMSSMDCEDTRPLNQMGLDSMMAGQLKRFIEKEFGAHISVIHILKGMTIQQLDLAIANMSEEPAPGLERSENTKLKINVDNLSDEQVNDILQTMLRTKPPHGNTSN